MDYCVTSKGTKVWLGSCWKFTTYSDKYSYLHVTKIHTEETIFVRIITGGNIEHETSVSKDFIDGPGVTSIDDGDEEVALVLLAMS